MKLKIPLALAMLAILGASTLVHAGPSCNVRPNHPNCEPSTEDPGPVYWVNLSNIVTGTEYRPGIYTTPGTLDGSETGLGANSNGPNEVRFVLYNFITGALGTDGFEVCFPKDIRLRGSIQLQDNIASNGGDEDRVGYIWVDAWDASGMEMGYAIDLMDLTGTWDNPLLPGVDETSSRSVSHWRLRTLKKKNVAECVSDGFIEVSGPAFTVTVQRVEKNPWYEE